MIADTAMAIALMLVLATGLVGVGKTFHRRQKLRSEQLYHSYHQLLRHEKF